MGVEGFKLGVKILLVILSVCEMMDSCAVVEVLGLELDFDGVLTFLELGYREMDSVAFKSFGYILLRSIYDDVSNTKSSII